MVLSGYVGYKLTATEARWFSSAELLYVEPG